MYSKHFLIHNVIILFVFVFNSCSAQTRTTKVKEQEQDIYKTESTQDQTTYNSETTTAHSCIIQDKEGIKYFDPNNNLYSLILKVPSNYNAQVNNVLSPDRKKLAFSFFDSKKKQTYLYVLFINEQKLKCLKNNTGLYFPNLIWDNDSLLISNFYDTKQDSKTKRWDIYNNAYTEIININIAKIENGFRPKKGAILINHIQNKYLIFADRDGCYIIDKKSNLLVKTLTGFNSKNNKDMIYSPDGKLLSYVKRIRVEDQNGDIDYKNELSLANYDGTNAKTIIKYKYDPQNIKWSPSGNQIICDIASQEWSNIRHLCFYNLLTNSPSFNTEEEYGFMPSFTIIEASPSGRYVLVMKKVEMQSQTSISYVIKDAESGAEIYIKNENGEIFDSYSLANFYKWESDNVILFFNNKKNSIYIYNITYKMITPFPSDCWLLFLSV